MWLKLTPTDESVYVWINMDKVIRIKPVIDQKQASYASHLDFNSFELFAVVKESPEEIMRLMTTIHDDKRIGPSF